MWPTLHIDERLISAIGEEKAPSVFAEKAAASARIRKEEKMKHALQATRSATRAQPQGDFAAHLAAGEITTCYCACRGGPLRRGTAVVRLALAEATVPQIATFTSQSLKGVDAILDAQYRGRAIQLAERPRQRSRDQRIAKRIASHPSWWAPRQV
jgi:hypothetical protein